MFKHRQTTLPQKNGFSLIEVVMSILILALTANFIAGYFMYSRKTAWQADKTIVANQLATSALETAKGQLKNPTSLATILNKIKTKGFYDVNSSQTQKGTAFKVKTTYVSAMTSANINLMQIRAIITWDNNHSIFLKTVYPYY
ncbi:MAG: type II secretion system protein [Fibrobacteria bacterium]|nr:type II secretion system protein [Fibrobacteria bacterium]